MIVLDSKDYEASAVLSEHNLYIFVLYVKGQGDVRGDTMPVL